MKRLTAGMLLVFLSLLLLASQPPPMVRAAELEKDRYVAVRDYRSPHIELRTDLPKDRAEELLSRLNKLMFTVAKYWGRKPSGVMTVYVAEHVDRWPPEKTASMDSGGIDTIRRGGGYCVYTTYRIGRSHRTKAIVYAAAHEGTVQHEIVHAYCSHAFGSTGPLWYAEGMAERGLYWGTGQKGVQAGGNTIAYLNRTPSRPISQIVQYRESGNWSDYQDWWSLCYFLDHHPKYAPTFRKLGYSYITGGGLAFEEAFAARLRPLAFEYALFRESVTRGYEVERTAWDWDREFRSAPTSGYAVARIDADRGWQPTGVFVRDGQSVHFRTEGEWSIEEDGPKLSADGLPNGEGRLIGVILTEDYELSRPFALGAAGRLESSLAGRLFVRCNDAFHELDDNLGRITLQCRGTPFDAP